jgi:hypothetical protein
VPHTLQQTFCVMQHKTADHELNQGQLIGAAPGRCHLHPSPSHLLLLVRVTDLLLLPFVNTEAVLRLY